MLRDSELRAIYGVYEDVLKGTPDREEDESNEDYAVSTNRYRQTKLKALQKYSGSKTKYGRMAVTQLNALGYSKAGIQQKLKRLIHPFINRQKAAPWRPFCCRASLYEALWRTFRTQSFGGAC